MSWRPTSIYGVSKISSLAGLVAKSVRSQSQPEKLKGSRVGTSQCAPSTTRISSQTTFGFKTWGFIQIDECDDSQSPVSVFFFFVDFLWLMSTFIQLLSSYILRGDRTRPSRDPGIMCVYVCAAHDHMICACVIACISGSTKHMRAISLPGISFSQSFSPWQLWSTTRGKTSTKTAPADPSQPQLRRRGVRC